MLISDSDDRAATALAVALTLLVVLGSLPGVTALAAQDTQSVQAPVEVTISEIQEPDDDGSASPYEGTNVTTTGTVTANNADGFFIQNGSGAWSGVYVYGSADVSPGDVVEVTGLVKEYNGVTEIDIGVETAEVTTTGTASVPAAVEVSTANASAEKYEGVLANVTDVSVTATPGQYGEWAVDDGSGELVVDDVTYGDITVPSETGGTIDSITGPVHYNFGAFKIQPKTLTNYTAPSDGSDDGGSGTQLTVLTYNDIQTAASNPTKMGRLVGAINDREAAIDNPTLVVGGGDQVSPNSLSPVSNWTVPVDTLNVLDPAAEVVGNHDLDFGFDAVENFSAASEFPWLVANIQQTDGGNIPGTQNYTIVERGDMKIGILGLVDDAVKSKTAVDFNEHGYEVQDFSKVGSRIATDLKQNQDVDVVVAAAHTGVPESEELARNTDNIDLIVTGDDEVLYGPETVDGTTIIEAQARAAYLGEVNLTVDGSDVSMAGGELTQLGADSDFTVNETANQTVADARGKFLSEVAGETEVALDSTFSSNYAEDTAWGNIITDAFIAEAGGDVAITNGGGIRGDFVMQPGEVTYDDVYTSLPFGNSLVTKQMTGEQLTELLASQVTALDNNYGGQAQLQVSGVTYEFVDRPGASDAVTDVYVEGDPIDMDATYNITLNSYMAGWTFGDRYGWNMSDLTTVNTDLTLYGTATVNYIEANTPITAPGHDRIRRVTRTAGTADVTARGDSTTLTFDVPNAVQSVDAASVHVHNATTGTVTATDASLSDGSLTATFDGAALSSLAAESDTLELYAEYTDSEYSGQRSGFDTSVLNGVVPADAEFTTTTTTVVRIGSGDETNVPLASGTEIPVVVEDASSGVGAYEFTVSVGDASTTRIEGFEPAVDAGMQSVSVSDDGSSVTVEVAVANADAGDSVRLGTLDVTGVTLDGTTTLAFDSMAGPFDADGAAYQQVNTETTIVNVTAGDVTGNGMAMTDLDGDGVYEDVNGDGEVNIVDAQALFAERNSDPTTESTTAFDLNGDGTVNVGDIQYLFAVLATA